MAKREHGYVITLKMFVPVDRSSLKDTREKADAVEAAQSSNDLSGLVGVGDIMSVAHRWTSREAAEAAVVHEPAETVQEIAGQAGVEIADEPQPEPVEPQQTGPASEGEAQQDAVEEAATGRKGRRS